MGASHVSVLVPSICTNPTTRRRRRRLGSYLDALAETVKVGKARAVGVSNFNVERLRYVHDYLASRGIALSSDQIQYSLLSRGSEGNGMLAACEELDIALIGDTPVGRGCSQRQISRGRLAVPSRVRAILTVSSWDIFHQKGNVALCCPQTHRSRRSQPRPHCRRGSCPGHEPERRFVTSRRSSPWASIENSAILPRGPPRTIVRSAQALGTRHRR